MEKKKKKGYAYLCFAQYDCIFLGGRSLYFVLGSASSYCPTQQVPRNNIWDVNCHNRDILCFRSDIRQVSYLRLPDGGRGLDARQRPC